MKVSAQHKRAGFTLIELLVVVSIIALLIGILLPALGRARRQAQQLTDGTQVREMQRALINFAQDNNEFYPFPNSLDRYDFTEGLDPEQSNVTDDDIRFKNRSGAVFAVLIFDGQVVTEQCVSPAEADGSIRPDPNFETSAPGIANTPQRALWDPAFVGTRDQEDGMWSSPNAGEIGSTDRRDDITREGEGSNFSYAHTPLFGARSDTQWAANFNATQPVLANRGPVYEEGQVGGAGDRISQTWELLGTPSGSGSAGQDADQGFQSPTLLIHGNKRSWAGNLGYNDNHVDFVSTYAPSDIRFAYNATGTATGPEEQVPDNVFFDEEWEYSEDAIDISSRTNIYLRQWARSIPGTAAQDLDLDGGDWNLGATWDGKDTWGLNN